jgi:DNA-binding LacI/PurR family transcriptional regulator
VGGGHEATRELLALADPPTAIFTGNNLLTIGALQAIHELGLRIPEQVALAAFDDVEWTVFLQPALTVVAQPTYEMGKVAALMLLDRIAEPDRPPRETMLAPMLHVRESSVGVTPGLSVLAARSCRVKGG